MLLICQDKKYFNYFYGEIANILSDYSDIFELYYTDDLSRVERHIVKEHRPHHFLEVILADPMQKQSYDKALRNGLQTP